MWHLLIDSVRHASLLRHSFFKYVAHFYTDVPVNRSPFKTCIGSLPLFSFSKSLSRIVGWCTTEYLLSSRNFYKVINPIVKHVAVQSFSVVMVSCKRSFTSMCGRRHRDSLLCCYRFRAIAFCPRDHRRCAVVFRFKWR